MALLPSSPPEHKIALNLEFRRRVKCLGVVPNKGLKMVECLVGGDNRVPNHPAADSSAGPAPSTPAVDVCAAARIQRLVEAV